jgi:glycosyltransferase involved in cell wall biosynthesis
MTPPLVSVITPVYNDEPYLEEAVRSVLAQTHEDFEYVICNNHSTDRSGEIARDYAAKDPRIRVVSPPALLPQAKNFNFALQQIADRAQYVKMLFADDWLFPDCLRQMLALAGQDPRIALVSSYRLVETTPDCFGLPVGRSVFPGREVLRAQLLGTAYPFGTNSTEMWRADVVRKRAPRFFPEDRQYFDIDVIFRTIADECFGFVHQVLSFTRYQEGAVSDEISNYNWWFLFQLMMMEQYGRDLLTPEEFQARYEAVSTDFYRGLGEVWIKDRLRRHKQQKFWDFQNKHLSSMGAQIDRKRLARGVLDAALYWAGHLEGTFGKVRARARRLRG